MFWFSVSECWICSKSTLTATSETVSPLAVTLLRRGKLLL